MQLPKVLEFNSSRDFIIALLTLNAGRRGFSERNLARRMKWPASLLADIKAGRKRLSIERAFQLGKYLKLDEFEIEYLVSLVLRESPTLEIQQVGQILSQLRHDVHHKKDGLAEVCESQELMAIIEFVSLAGRLPSEEEFAEVTGGSSIGLSEKIKRLERLGVVGYSKKGEVILKPDNMRDDPTPGAESIMLREEAFMRAYRGYLHRGAVKPRSISSGYFKATEEEFENIRKKLIAFRNSLAKFESRSMEKHPEKCRLFQCELRMFPVTPEAALLPTGERKRRKP